MSYLHIDSLFDIHVYYIGYQGYHSVLSQSLTTEHALGKIIRADDIQSFSSDPTILAFAEYFCGYTTQKVGYFAINLISCNFSEKI